MYLEESKREQEKYIESLDQEMEAKFNEKYSNNTKAIVQKDLNSILYQDLEYEAFNYDFNVVIDNDSVTHAYD